VQDGVTWVALKLAGDNDEWFYVPQQAAIASRTMDAPDGYPFSVLVNGKPWQITAHANGCYTYDGFKEPDPSDTYAPTFMAVLITSGLFTPLCLAGFLSAAKARGERQGAELELQTVKDIQKKREADFRAERQQFMAERIKARERLIVECEKLNAIRDRWEKEIQAKRDELEKERRVMVVAAQERQVMNHKLASTDERRQFGQVVRDQLLAGKETSREISVEYALDPEMTGSFVFCWQLVQARPYALSLTVLRDGSVIRTASGVFKGQFGSWLKTPGEHYIFTFKVYDGSVLLPEPLVIELTLPPLEAWNRRDVKKPPAPELTPEERERASAVWEKKEKQRAAECEKDPEKLRKIFAKIERERMERFGEAG
jgi:hypothetical protein